MCLNVKWKSYECQNSSPEQVRSSIIDNLNKTYAFVMDAMLRKEEAQ